MHSSVRLQTLFNQLTWSNMTCVLLHQVLIILFKVRNKDGTRYRIECTVPVDRFGVRVALGVLRSNRLQTVIWRRSNVLYKPKTDLNR